jgi:hypothetical protein
VFVPGKSFQPSLMFVGKARAYPSEVPFRCPTLGLALALPTNIRLGWKGLPGTNTLQKSVNYVSKKFYSTGPLLNSKTRKRTYPGSAITNGREPRSCLGRVFNSKLGCIVTLGSKCMVYMQPLLKLKTRPKACPVS